MVLCFCHRASMSLSPPPGDGESHPVPLSPSALPAAPRPARLARPGASDTVVPPVLPSTPPPRAFRLRGGTAEAEAGDVNSSPRQGSDRCPIPKIPDFEGLADSETDSDDELLSRARMRAAGLSASPVSSTPVSLAPGGVGGTDGTGVSPLTSLISRIGIIGRTSPVRSVNHGRAPEASCSTDDLMAAARRAEVRRLTQKMIQEELQIEQLQQQKHHQHQPQQYNSRSYKRSSMSTIKEDPSDISAHDLSHPYNTVSIMDGSGYRTSLEYTFARSREDFTAPPALAGKGKEASTYLLPKPPMLPPPASSKYPAAQASKSGLPQGVAARGQARGNVQIKGPKSSILASFATNPSARRPLPGASPFAQSEASKSKEAAKATTGVASKTVSSSTHETDPQNSLRAKHVVSNGQFQSDKNDNKQGTVVPQNQVVSDSLSSVDEDGSIHEARKARVVVSGRASSPLITAVTKLKKNGRRKASESSQISALDLPPPLANLMLSSDGAANTEVQPTRTAIFEETSAQNPPAQSGPRRLPFLSLDRLSFGLGKSKTDPPASESQAQQAKPSTFFRNASGSVASFGAQLECQSKEKAFLNGRDSASDKSQYHSMTSATLKVWTGESPPGQGEHASAVHKPSQVAACATTTTDIEKMADEWHQQIQKLDHNSPVRTGGASNSTTTQRRSISHTYPISNQSSGLRDLPHRQSAMGLWPDVQRSRDLGFNNQAGTRRHTLSFDAQQLSDSWWSELKWQEPKAAPSDHGAADLAPNAEPSQEQLSDEIEANPGLASIKSENTMVHNEASSPEPEPSYSRVFSSGIEKAIRAGFKKVLYRNQASTASLTPAMPAATASNRSLEAQCSTTATANHSKASSLKVERSAPGSRTITPILESRLQVTASESPQTPSRKDGDMIQDIDSIFGVLVDVESNQRTAPVTPVKPQQSKADDDNAFPENEIVSPQTVPSTPIANAYAEVRAYISAVLPGTPARRLGVQELHNSPSSSYQEAPSHQGGSLVCATTRAKVQAAACESLDSLSAKSDSAPTKKAAGSDTSLTKYMTWNGRTGPKAQPPALKSTTQFSADLENIFLGKKENRKAFQGQTLQPAVEQN